MPERGNGGEGAVGDLAIVLHAHMPYVEGFGTYPFGEEWLFDAVIRSYLPVLGFARDLTVSVTPVLADQLEAHGVRERLLAFVRDFRVGSARREIELAGSDLRESAEDELTRYEAALSAIEDLDGDLLAMFLGPGRDGAVELIASSATHAILPLIATDRAIETQVSTGLRSHLRRFGRPTGFWLPELAFEPGIEAVLATYGIEWFPLDQSRFESADESLAPVLTPAGNRAFTIDWTAVSWVWDLEGYPSWPGYRDFHAKSGQGLNLFRIDGGPYDPREAAARARSDADRFLEATRERLVSYRERTGESGLVVFACDMELMGHWWAEGPIWLEAVLDRAAEQGVRLTTPGREMGRAARQVPLMRGTWGAGKDFRTWDSPGQADLAVGARRLEIAVGRAVGAGLPRPVAERAVRELLAVQSSDWAFLDSTRQAGDYPYHRAVEHARSAYEALHSDIGEAVEPGLRALAPDLDLTPLLVP